MASIPFFAQRTSTRLLRLSTALSATSSIQSSFPLLRNSPGPLPLRNNGAAAVRYYGSPPPPLPTSPRLQRLEERNRSRIYTKPTFPASLDVATEEMKDDTMYDDIGLMPETFVMPTGINKPSVISQPKLRLAMEWHRAKSKVLMVVRSLFIKWFQTKGMNPPLKLEWFKLSSIAVDLYKQMNTGFAEANKDKISPAVTNGFLKMLDRRLSRRGDVRLKWGFTTSPKARLIVDTITTIPYHGTKSPVPGENVHLLRQAVVQIKGEQSLEQGQVVEDEGSKKEVVAWDRLPVKTTTAEYVVIQQRVLRGKTEPWKIWGTTRETSTEAFEEMRKRQGHRSADAASKVREQLF